MNELLKYRRVVLLVDRLATPFLAKTAISMLRYRPDDIAAVLDTEQAGTTAEVLFGVGGKIPVVATLRDVDADALFIGIAPPGGMLPEHFRPFVEQALSVGIDVVSGLHDFLSNDPALTLLAKTHSAKILDVRKNPFRQTATGGDIAPDCLRVHSVGQDCSVGKMVATLEIQRELCRRGEDASFLATGQTGIMVSGKGLPIDCMVADFVNGAAERLVTESQDHEILLIEGQGSISHPSFSAVTVGLLHGCAPDGLVFCYEMGRKFVKGLDNIPLLPIGQMMDAYERTASLRHPCRIIGIAINSRNASAEEATEERDRVGKEFGLPACDVYRDGASALADAVVALKRELKS
ncbi:DUF1611 domain-containing protein [Novipirellula artificiosorum]|uniref:DUF1611 domain-containing protein n=1 Tax=Novipirellula artificiosorum TaxID=2528016 RepID=A0A5C6DJB5_9BACT|nr:DUF1611 domain-containing protein [Novipirellula artificiosorum]TWU35006.1 hypothetical protein Poly41_41500 [Novipirellula artificiosorum]